MVHLILDFDGTITQGDSIGELARAALSLHQPQSSQIEAAWADAVRSYGADVAAYRREYQPGEAQRRSVADEVRYLAGLKGVEEASLHRVGRSGLFAGLGPERLFRMGVEAVEARRVVVRDGLADVVELAKRRGWRVDVVSVNWSAAFIRGVVDPLDIRVTANEIGADGSIVGPGRGLGADRITTSADKLRAVARLVDAADDGRGSRVLYFGDSTTDLQCLLDRDGVVVADAPDSPLLQALGRVGVAVPHVRELSSRGQGQGLLGWASSFRDVMDSGLFELWAD